MVKINTDKVASCYFILKEILASCNCPQLIIMNKILIYFRFEIKPFNIILDKRLTYGPH